MRPGRFRFSDHPGASGQIRASRPGRGRRPRQPEVPGFLGHDVSQQFWDTGSRRGPPGSGHVLLQRCARRGRSVRPVATAPSTGTRAKPGATAPALSTIHRLLARSGSRHTPTPKNAPYQMETLRVSPAQPDVAVPHDSLPPQRPPVEIINFIDNYSGAVAASIAVPVAPAARSQCRTDLLRHHCHRRVPRLGAV
jgi:hypothetical protein